MGNGLNMLNLKIILFTGEILGSTELSLILVLVIVMVIPFGFRVVIVLLIILGIAGLSIGIIVIAILIEPATLPTVLEDMVGSFDREA